MAVLTPDVISPDTAGGFGIDFMHGLKHVRLSFQLTPWVNNTDTYTPTNGDEVTIVACAWQANTSDDPVVATITSGNLVTFASGSSDNVGYLHCWITG